MKKLLTTIMIAAASASAVGKEYNDLLTVTVDGKVMSSAQTVINVDKNDDGTYNMTLKNFKLGVLKIGTIVIDNVPAVSNGQTTMLKVSRDIKIQKGEGTGPWIGESLGNVPVNMAGELRDNDNKFYTNITISMSVQGAQQNINVEFGDGRYQLPNAGFEAFHTASLTQPTDPDDPDENPETVTSDEPDNWHSFMSASGPEGMVYLAGFNPVTFKSSEVRPGSTGKQSVMLKSVNIMGPGFIANGTITTGRMNTGGMSAADATTNYAWSDITTTDKDAHGDPFFATIYSRPDAMKVWVKYTQEAGDPNYPYATATAILNDGTRLQEPAAEGVTYNNIVGEARDPQIADTKGEWKELSIPFSYKDFASNNATAKSVLVTFSTNAAPGQGSHSDENAAAADVLYVDDMSFVYNAGLAAVTFTDPQGSVYLLNVEEGKNNYAATLPFDVTASNFKAMSDGQGAYVSTTLADRKATIEITSNDLKTTNIYTVDIKKGDASGVTSSISDIATEADNTVKAVFTIDGKRVNAMDKAGLYIVKMANGQSKKVLKK